MRARTAVIVDSATWTPSFTAAPARMLAIRSLCPDIGVDRIGFGLEDLLSFQSLYRAVGVVQKHDALAADDSFRHAARRVCGLAAHAERPHAVFELVLAGEMVEDVAVFRLNARLPSAQDMHCEDDAQRPSSLRRGCGRAARQ